VLNRRLFLALGAAGTIAACAAPRGTGSLRPAALKPGAKGRLVFSSDAIANVYNSHGDLVVDGNRIASRLLDYHGGRRLSSVTGGGGSVAGNAWDQQLHWTNSSSYHGWMASSDNATNTALYSDGFGQPVRINGYLPLVASAMVLHVSPKAVARKAQNVQQPADGGGGDGGGGGGGVPTPAPSSDPSPFDDGGSVIDSPGNDGWFSSGSWDDFGGISVDGYVDISDEYGNSLLWSNMIPTIYASVPTMSPKQWADCNSAIRRMFIDAGLGIGAAVGVGVATGGLGVGIAAWIAAFAAAAVIADRMDVDRLCGPGSPYYNPSTYGG
jgi:hypothetical protein